MLLINKKSLAVMLLCANCNGYALNMNSVPVDNVSFTGLTVFQQQELGKKVRFLSKGSLTMEQAKNMQEQIERIIEEKGYFLSEVVVNEAAFAEGKLQFDVYEGFISHVIMENPEKLSKSAYKNVMGYLNKVTKHTPLHKDDYEKYVLMADDLSGVELEVKLQPSEVLGASEMRVTIKETNRMNAFATVNNEINTANGPMQALGGLILNTPEIMGTSSILGSHSTSGNKFRLMSASHYQDVTYNGLSLGVDASRVISSPNPKQSDSSNLNSGTLKFQAAYPVFKNFRKTLIVKGMADGVNATNESSNSANEYKDKIRSLRAVGHLEFLHTIMGKYSSQNILEAQVSKGIKAFKASKINVDAASRAEGKSDYTKVNLSLHRVQHLSNSFYLLAHANSQYSFSKLLSVEEFDLGGDDFGRGYQSGVLSGDKGAALKLEFHYSKWFPKVVYDLDAFAFYDMGFASSKTEKITIDATTGETRKRASLNSAGLGVNLTSYRFIKARATVGKPLSFPSRKSVRWTFSVTADLNHKQ